VKTKEDTPKTYINKSFFSFLFSSIGNEIGCTGVTSLSEALKSNTTLTKLNLNCEDKRKKTHKRHPSTIYPFSLLFISTVNNIEYIGATALSEALKSNTTLTKLCLESETKERRHTKDIHQ
jgi:hypothetical protein